MPPYGKVKDTKASNTLGNTMSDIMNKYIQTSKQDIASAKKGVISPSTSSNKKIADSGKMGALPQYSKVSNKKGWFHDVASPTGWSYSNARGGINVGAKAPTNPWQHILPASGGQYFHAGNIAPDRRTAMGLDLFDVGHAFPQNNVRPGMALALGAQNTLLDPSWMQYTYSPFTGTAVKRAPAGSGGFGALGGTVEGDYPGAQPVQIPSPVYWSR